PLGRQWHWHLPSPRIRRSHLARAHRRRYLLLLPRHRRHHLFNIDSEGNVVVLALGDEFQEVNRFSLGQNIVVRSTPAMAQGHLYLRTASELIAVAGQSTSPER
ncbi:MAG: hypothetical protein AAF357_00950, partial [Verrucomicrobiota bacterium]